jgi:hypothetical protein
MLFQQTSKTIAHQRECVECGSSLAERGVRTCATDHRLSAESFAQRSYMNGKRMLFKVLFAIGFLGLCSGCEIDSVECSPSLEANVNNRTSIDVVSTNSL